MCKDEIFARGKFDTKTTTPQETEYKNKKRKKLTVEKILKSREWR